MRKRNVKVLIADDHALVLAGFAKLIGERYTLAGVLDSAYGLVETAERTKPDVILLDMSMPGVNGVQAARKLRTRVPEARVIFVTVHDEQVFVDAALAAGACGYVLKQSAEEELMTAIETVMAGESYVTPLIGDYSPTAAAERPELTERQIEVLRLIASGLSSRETAEKLGISNKAVEFHRTRIRAALKLKSTADLTRYAIRNGIVPL